MEKLSTITSSVPLLKASEVNQGPVRLISAELHSLAIPGWKDMKQNYMSILYECRLCIVDSNW